MQEMQTFVDYWEIATILVGGFATIAIFSFLVGENPYFRFFEHLYIGISAGLGTVLAVKSLIWPDIIAPMLGYNLVQYPDGSYAEPYNPLYLLYIPPMLFGLLYYFIYSKRYAWLAKLVIGFSLGMSGGIAFKAFFSEWMPQLESSFKPLIVMAEGGGLNWWKSFENTVFVLTLLSVMYYFFFSFRRTSPVLEKFAYGGRWMMMICFGAFFGSTIMARMALLVERLQFLIVDWSGAIKALYHALV